MSGRVAAGVLAGLFLAGGCHRDEPVAMDTVASDAWLDHPAVRAVTFHPRRETTRPAPAGVEALTIPLADGVTLGARFHAAGAASPTVLLFHGNGEIAADYDNVGRCYTAMDLNLLVVDYRGYGRSTGEPTVSTLLDDAVAAYIHVRGWLREAGYAAPVIVMGRSLGSAAAIEIAARLPSDVDGLVVESGFAHLTPLLERLGATVPPRAAGGPDPAGHLRKIRLYEGPTLIIHGERDEIIPVGDARALHAASASPRKRLLTVPGAGHNTLFTVGFDAYMRALADFAAPLRTGGGDGVEQIRTSGGDEAQ